MFGFLLGGKCSLFTTPFSGLRKYISINLFQSLTVLKKMTKIVKMFKRNFVLL